MAKTGRPPVLDEYKRREILAILSIGCSRRTAARYVGCAARTIQNTADRDPAFAEKLRRAQYKAEIGYMKNIQKAADEQKYWRAAAWALERINPEEFVARKPDTMTLDQFSGLLASLVEILIEEVPVAKYRKAVIRRVERLIAEVEAGSKHEADDEA